jgi:hypothetical protein
MMADENANWDDTEVHLFGEKGLTDRFEKEFFKGDIVQSFMKFKITFKQQLLLILPLILKNGILFGVYFYFFGFEFSPSFYTYILFFIILFDILPAILVHIQYLPENRSVILAIDKETRELTYNSPSRVLKYSFDDIHTVQHFASYGGGTGAYSFGEYRYFKIIFKDKVEVIITCLMINNIKNTLADLLGAEVDKRLRVVAFIY